MGPDELLRYVTEAFEAAGVPYLITGSVASAAYGDPRLTNDIDLVADLRPAQVPALKARFPEEDFYFDEQMVLQSIRTGIMFNIIHPASGLKVDVVPLPPTEFARAEFARRRRERVGDHHEAWFATPEDVIISKMDFYRMGQSEKHIRDILGILMSSAQPVDRGYIHTWAARLGLSEIWEAILRRLEAAESGR